MAGIVDTIGQAIQSGLNQDWVTMGTNIAKALAQGIDVVSGFIG
ncbi:MULTISPECIES: beta-class phenol-soluble modulin [Staphylococcus]|nr:MULTISPECIES: beta-class phenol-soluble modulin [Staphylococcus]KXA44340.1 hemolysin H1U [Staphylococcus simulans]OFN21102.1 hemolysin activation protein [Staphylococcus sp. HMSC055C03]OFU76127.1 hemolysin activation protein [Staphylococcus sp. HMSC10C03]OHR56520.1 hemolysin activation protein [Staphylococcus sp. HMSC070A03]OHR59044.1 hemolysin activation protein [Staphylococcus sp. HMSC070A02]